MNIETSCLTRNYQRGRSGVGPVSIQNLWLSSTSNRKIVRGLPAENQITAKSAASSAVSGCELAERECRSRSGLSRLLVSSVSGTGKRLACSKRMETSATAAVLRIQSISPSTTRLKSDRSNARNAGSGAVDFTTRLSNEDSRTITVAFAGIVIGRLAVTDIVRTRKSVTRLENWPSLRAVPNLQ